MHFKFEDKYGHRIQHLYSQQNNTPYYKGKDKGNVMYPCYSTKVEIIASQMSHSLQYKFQFQAI